MLADPALTQNSARALRDIVLHAGRPDAPRERRAVERQLLAAISKSEGQPRQDLIRVLSEIGGDRSVPLLTQLLANPETWESARYALIRIPGRKSLAALKAAWADAEGEARFALAEALRARGSETGATPKLTPTRGTEVKPKAGKSA